MLTSLIHVEIFSVIQVICMVSQLLFHCMSKLPLYAWGKKNCLIVVNTYQLPLLHHFFFSLTEWFLVRRSMIKISILRMSMPYSPILHTFTRWCSIHYLKKIKFIWWQLGDALTYLCNSKLLRAGLILWIFSRTIVNRFPPRNDGLFLYRFLVS